MDKQEIIDFLRLHKQELNIKFGVLTIGLFGSYAKGEENENSDIDILVELKEPRFSWLAGLHLLIEKKFGKNIEIIRKNNHMKTDFIEHIEESIIYV